MTTDSKIVIGADVSAVSAGFAKVERDAAKLTGSLGRAAREGFGQLDRSARDTVQQTAERFNLLGGSLERFAGLLGGLAAGGAVFAWLRSGIADLVAFQDAADATGATVDKLGALEEIARRNGGNLDQVTSAIVRLNQGLNDTNPDSPTARVLRAIGLEAEELRRLDPAEALQRVAVALAGFADTGEKARAVQQLFGRSVREVAPLLNDLAEAGDLSSKSLAAGVEQADKFDKQISRLQGNLTALTRTILGSALPALNQMIERMQARGVGQVLADDIRLKWAQGLSQIANERLNDATKQLEKLLAVPEGDRGFYTRNEIAQLRKEITGLQRDAAAASERVKSLIGGSFEPPRAVASEERPVIDVPESAGGSSGTRGSRELARLTSDRRVRVRTPGLNVDPSIRRGASELERQLSAYERLQEQAAGFVEQLKLQNADLNASLIQDDRARGEAQIEIDRQTMQARIDALRAAGVDMTAAQDELNANLLARQRLLEEQLKPQWRRLLDDWGDTTGHMAKSFDELMEGVVAHSEESLARFIRTGKLSVSDLADYVLQTLARLAAQGLVSQLASLGDVVFGGGLGGGLAKGGVVAGGEITAFANGGVVNGPTFFPMTRGRLGLMGEAGPEAVMPLERRPDGLLGVRASGDSSKVFNINVNVAATPGMSRDTALQQGYRVGQGIQRAMARSA